MEEKQEYDTRVGHMTIDILCKDVLKPILESKYHRDNNPQYSHYTNIYNQFQKYQTKVMINV